MSHTKAHLLAGTALVAVGVAFAGSASADGHAKVVKSSKDQVSLTISGQFSREMVYVDDGHSGRVRHQDSDYSSSRFLLNAAGKINADMKVGAKAEIAIDDARNGISNNTDSTFGGRSGNDLRTRKAEIFITHNSFGRVYIGAGDSAANGTMNTASHGVYSALINFAALTAANVQFRNEGAAGNASSGSGLSGVTLAGANPDLDFNSRTTRIRYDTPVIAGFMGSVSHHDDQAVEAALRYSGKIFDTKIKAAVGFAEGGAGAGNNEFYAAGFAAEHSSGLGISISCGYENEDANSSTAGAADPAKCGIQGHFARKFNELGKTTLVIEHEQTDNANREGDTAKAYGVTLHQAIDAAAMEIWAKWATFELDRDGSNFDDVDLVSIGTRVKF